MNKQVVLGIDPGLSIAGFSILIKEKGHPKLIDYGCLKFLSTQSLVEKVGIFTNFFDEKITTYQVTHIALETPFLNKNAQSFLKLGYLRGIIYFLSYRYNIVLCEFAPMQVKLSVTGYGKASKDQVARVVGQLFLGLGKPEKYDISDAIAIGLCGFWTKFVNK